VAPLRVAVVGAGPAGFFAAARLLDADVQAQVDVIERLPTPWGLVRLGVAPDHPTIKSVSRVFEATAGRPGFRFLGNVEVGRDVRHDELSSRYAAVVYALGAREDRRLGIPGESLPGSLPSSAFVGWYNGDPEHAGLDVDLACERAIVVGNGNVALDAARMLALPADQLAATDIADHALGTLARSAIREIVVLGRRGPAEASFTTAELRELGVLDAVDVTVAPVTHPDAESLEPRVRRNVELLGEWAARPAARGGRTIRLRFLASPVAVLGVGRVEGLEIARNRLVAVAHGRRVAVPTREHETLACGLVVSCAGYRGVRVPGVPFDERSGTIPNDGGRVVDVNGRPAPGVYCAGWIKRGPSGVIGTNKKDAAATVDALLADLRAGRLPRLQRVSTLDGLLEARAVEVVDDAGWRRIDELERARGDAEGRPRVKLCSRESLLAAAAARDATAA
jgi:ferredoxin--NADP+ reductase